MGALVAGRAAGMRDERTFICARPYVATVRLPTTAQRTGGKPVMFHFAIGHTACHFAHIFHPGRPVARVGASIQ